LAKTLIIKLSSQIIADFQSCFDKKEDERSYLYKNSTQKINEGVGDAFIKKKTNLRLMKDGKTIIKSSTLDEINFDSVELSSNPEWRSEDIAGELEPFEYIAGAAFWEKISNWAKLASISNQKFNESLIVYLKKSLSDLKSNGNIDENIIKHNEDLLSENEEKITKFENKNCIESYVYSIFSQIIINKIKSKEQEILDKEFAELNKPKKTEKPPVVT